jgi:3-oxoacyl-(acyl-carrier-protein) synthase
VPHRSVEYLAAVLGWGAHVTIVSHACVSAHLGLLLATRQIHAGLAEEALVFSFDFLSPFVTGGFHALKILNPGMPAPYAERETGSIGLGDGAAFAVLGGQREASSRSRARLLAQSFHNEMHHFTGNQPDGAGFARCLKPLTPTVSGRRVWIKGHGTGTLDAGRLEAESCAQFFPNAPLVSWKGSLGHTLGSCGLVELAVAIAAREAGTIPGTIGSAAPTFTGTVALAPRRAADFDAAILTSNAFGGAHAAFVLDHD